MKPQTPVLLAIIGAAQGLKGELRVKSYTADPEGFSDYGPLYDNEGRSFEVVTSRPSKEVVIVKFKGINDRTMAEKLTGTELFVDKSKISASDDDDFLHSDLIGLAARDLDGADLGKVSGVFNFGAGDILEIVKPGAKAVAIPFSKAAVPTVNIIEQYLIVDQIAAGLIVEDGEGPHNEMGPLEMDPEGDQE